MSELVRFESGDGSALLVEVDEDTLGVERVSRDDKGVLQAGQRLDEALESMRPTIRRLVEVLRDLGPEQHEIEFGLKLNAEAGVFVAKTAVEGHFSVKLTWKQSATGS